MGPGGVFSGITGEVYGEVAQLPHFTSLKLGGMRRWYMLNPSLQNTEVLLHSVCDCGLSRIGSLQMIKLDEVTVMGAVQG